MVLHLRRSRMALGRRTRRIPLYTLVLFILWTLLPFDNTIRQAVRFNFVRLLDSFSPNSHDRWVSAPPLFPVDLAEDVLVIVKTGYGTRNRLAAWFKALSPQSQLGDLIIIGDYASAPDGRFTYRGQDLPVHDVVNRTLSDLAFSSVLSEGASYPRISNYESLGKAIANGDEEKALHLSQTFGWELDSMKDVSSLELAYEMFPQKKWYILLDDDTYLVQPSVVALLGHLDARFPHYLGNAVGDFRARFAHGGSSIILSQGAMRVLFDENPDSVSTAHVESLTTIWGDRLIARALVRSGVFLEERYSHFFSGEPPRLSKLRADRMCSPIVTFHKLSDPSDMLDVGKRFETVDKPFEWARLWDVYGDPSLWRQGIAEARQDWDHVGNPDEAVATIHGVKTVEKCARHCAKYARTCLAWTWDSVSKDCHVSPWMIVGKESKGKISGINAKRAKRLAQAC
ncbi:hypothetical protein QBC47DRAFT_367055 [Echria macrotheca]|uniref:N-acetylgalactosaminide beta-1,3-galactosyltransferase n=1 Tax=Echria macrotheca TaxID=438768 RepID=A0AAJ0BP42_9PEZI|nr:hypothetical protein QBC47DRAFT_367055 [Echria macrotheca]